MPGSGEAVVLLNLGAPESEAAVKGFIASLLSDPAVMPLPWPLRGVMARFIASRRHKAVASRYRELGGRSPLHARTRDQVEALKKVLGGQTAVRYAFRHSEPRAPAVLANLAAAGVKRIVAVPMYPQWSASTTGSAVRDAVSAGKTFGIPVEPVGSFPDNAGFIEALSEPLNAVFSPGDHVIFCAHGLPMKLIRRGDPYLGDVGRTVDALRSKLPPGAGFSTAFQSRVGRMEWTGPDVKDEVRRLAREGNRSIVVVPVSFACENLETLHELDVDLRAFAEGCGVERFMRVPAPGTHPAFIRGLAGLIEAARAGAGARGSDHGG